jgi:hypothetical protein
MSLAVLADVHVPWKKAAVLGEQIKERSCMLAGNNCRMKLRGQITCIKENRNE